MNEVIFYSWQSDLPSSSNKNFLGSALENAAKRLRRDASIAVQPVVDRDTRGVPGSPDVVNTILEKIRAASVFVCDLSLINPEANGRKTPNPNVLLELGYAVHALGWDRIVLIFNEAYGTTRDLPFDLGNKRVLLYTQTATAATAGQQSVTDALVGKLREIFRRTHVQAGGLIRWGSGPEKIDGDVGRFIEQLPYSQKLDGWKAEFEFVGDSNGPYSYLAHPETFGDSVPGVGLDGGFLYVARNLEVTNSKGKVESYALFRSVNAIGGPNCVMWVTMKFSKLKAASR